MGTVVFQIELYKQFFPEGNELIQPRTEFCKSNCIDANYIESSSNNMPAIAKACWWAMYSNQVYPTF